MLLTQFYKSKGSRQMTTFSKTIDWYPNNVLGSLKANEPTTAGEVTPTDTMPKHTTAQDVPNYPAVDPAGDELAEAEIITNGDTLTEKGEID